MKNPVYLLGIDIGGTKIGIGLGDSEGRILMQSRIDNRNTRPEAVLPQLAAEARRFLTEAKLKPSDVAMFGISSPSPADIPNGVITTPPNNPYWRNVPIKSYLEQELGIRGTFENDANCGALAEWYFGAGKGCTDMIYLTMSTGIGAGIIAGGRLIQGKGFLAGEIGHTVQTPGGRLCNCGLQGCYEAYCGGRAVAQRLVDEVKDCPDHPMRAYAPEGKVELLDMPALIRAAHDKVDYAVKLWDEICLRNAQAYGSLMNIFNPERLVLGTIVWSNGDFFLEPVRRYLPRFAWRETLECCELVPSALKQEIGSYAGIAGARYALEQGR